MVMFYDDQLWQERYSCEGGCPTLESISGNVTCKYAMSEEKHENLRTIRPTVAIELEASNSRLPAFRAEISQTVVWHIETNELFNYSFMQFFKEHLYVCVRLYKYKCSKSFKE